MFNNKKIPYLNLIPILFISFILFKLVNNIETNVKYLTTFLKYSTSILSPFIWAFAIAYILNPLMNSIEKNLKLKRIWSLLITYLIVFGIIIIAITILSPQIIKNIRELFKDLPEYIDQAQKWSNSAISNLNIFEKFGITSYVNKNINSIIQQISTFLNSILSIAITQTIKVTSTVIKIIFGFIISVYLLKDKEIFIYNIKRLLYAFIKKSKVENIVTFFREADSIFSKFIIGKSIDSLIIGLLCFIILTIINTPYSILIGAIVGITNMIPYFGPFIGMIPAFIITVFYSPLKAIWVLVCIILLQQFDGWILGPKILGTKTGLNPFWVILAITIGGGTCGIIGMFLGVPVAAIIKISLNRFINKKISEKNKE